MYSCRRIRVLKSFLTCHLRSEALYFKSDDIMLVYIEIKGLDLKWKIPILSCKTTSFPTLRQCRTLQSMMDMEVINDLRILSKIYIP